eukprot:TCONS_00037141-protein
MSTVNLLQMFSYGIQLNLLRITTVCPEHLTNILTQQQDSYLNPRRLIDIIGPSLLVGRLYNCKLYSHKVRSSHKQLLDEIPFYANDILFGFCTQTKYHLRKEEFHPTVAYHLNELCGC